MQNLLGGDTFTMILITSQVIIIVISAYLALLMTSNKRIIQEQRLKIEAIQKSEQRYKALFENSLAGMMKFNYTSWLVLDANQTIIEMFNCKSKYELQQVFAEFPFEKFYNIESSLLHDGFVDSCEIEFKLKSGIKRRFLFSARREGDSELAHAVIVFDSAFKSLG